MFGIKSRLAKSEPFPEAVEAFSRSFPITAPIPNVYVIWENRWDIFGLVRALGTIYEISGIKGQRLVYLPEEEHNWHPQYKDALAKARELSLIG